MVTCALFALHRTGQKITSSPISFSTKLNCFVLFVVAAHDATTKGAFLFFRKCFGDLFRMVIESSLLLSSVANVFNLQRPFLYFRRILKGFVYSFSNGAFYNGPHCLTYQQVRKKKKTDSGLNIAA